MGLAASQARFLGITLRKANCEFQSTQLAEQKLQISNQLSDISQEYSNAMNATKLMWCNDLATSDYGLSYSLLMMPSAVNDYNPYFVTTKSGALVLNSGYAYAAQQAGIGLAGGAPSAEGRNKFIKALSGQIKDGSTWTTDTSINPGLATKETADRIVDGISSSNGSTVVSAIKWNRSAGMGAAPEDKGVMDTFTLNDMIKNNSIGGASLDWLSMYIKDGEYVTENMINKQEKSFNVQIQAAKSQYLAYEQASTTSPTSLAKIIGELENDNIKNLVIATTEPTANTIAAYNSDFNIRINDSTSTQTNTNEGIMKQFKKLEFLIDNASNDAARNEYVKQLNNLKKGLDIDGKEYADSARYGVCWAYYDKYKNAYSSNVKTISWDNTTNITNLTQFVDRTTTTSENTVTKITVNMKDLFQTESNKIEDRGSSANPYQMTVISNGVIVSNEEDLKGMTIADLLKDDIVLMNWWSGIHGTNAIEEMSYRAEKLMDYIAEVFGAGHIGTGLNIDSSTDQALNSALATVKNKYLKAGNATGANLAYGWNQFSPTSCSAYIYANQYNRIGTDKYTNTAAVNLSNMVSAFLTYFDNYLRGTESQYVVGKGNNDKDGDYKKTYFVTEDPSYSYIVKDSEAMSNDEKIADFYDELYNNICAHGWRRDDSVDQSDYLESTIKDGRYSLTSLNEDGYFYQTRYNETGYLKEVTDSDAISRAETEYTQKKAELTYKEDIIDVKTKKLDAEIAELNTEISSVQNIISKGIEKTFQMFQN